MSTQQELDTKFSDLQIDAVGAALNDWLKTYNVEVDQADLRQVSEQLAYVFGLQQGLYVSATQRVLEPLLDGHMILDGDALGAPTMGRVEVGRVDVEGERVAQVFVMVELHDKDEPAGLIVVGGNNSCLN